MNQTFRDSMSMRNGRNRSTNVYFLSSTASFCFSLGDLRSSNMSSVIDTLLVSATFLMISLASSSLPLESNHRIDSGSMLLYTKFKILQFCFFYYSEHCFSMRMFAIFYTRKKKRMTEEKIRGIAR